ncbi:MAG: hypothetical protein C4542_05545 [Dehalococcoidia bacterium]|nr:MAG: hypothetical protein C4542_05545 [Dehalococcoidia bacterium]
MPCDGIAVLTAKVALPEGIEITAETLQAVVNFYRNLKYEAHVLSEKTISINGYTLRIDNDAGAAVVRGVNAPQYIVDGVKNAVREITGILAQEKIAAEIASTCQVLEQQSVGGYVVLRVNL